MTKDTTNIWLNGDGLHVKFPGATDNDNLVYSVAAQGDKREIVAEIDYSRLPAGAQRGTDYLINDVPNAYVPSGAIVTKATLYVDTAFTSGGAATLTLGFVKNDGSTVIDSDGIDAAIALTAIDAVGDQIACDGALVGGAALTEDAYPSVNVGTADYTAGAGKLIIEYYVPRS